MYYAWRNGPFSVCFITKVRFDLDQAQIRFNLRWTQIQTHWSREGWRRITWDELIDAFKYTGMVGVR